MKNIGFMRISPVIVFIISVLIVLHIITYFIEKNVTLLESNKIYPSMKLKDSEKQSIMIEINQNYSILKYNILISWHQINYIIKTYQ